MREADLTIVRVPGSHEVPWAVQRLAAAGRFDAVIALGVLIAGDTNHHEMVGDAVAALLRVQIAQESHRAHHGLYAAQLQALRGAAASRTRSGIEVMPASTTSAP